jgi:predicted transcriptional regulator
MDRVNLTVKLPKVFVPLVGVTEDALPAEIEKLLAAELVRRGSLTYAMAAELLNISQSEFITYLSAQHISIFQFAPDELREEVRG